MNGQKEIWRPGSFTKNFSWGDGVGISELHAVIRAGFADTMADVSRDEFRDRIRPSGKPDYIPMNFFLFNKVVGGKDIIVADELVFQALSWDHGPAFDRLALFAFVFSYAGRWKGAQTYQRRPAMWANAYVRDRVAKDLGWDERRITADDIQRFVDGDPRYQAETSRKLATNLNYLLHIGHVSDFSEKRVSRWWVDCLFLALDRLIEDSRINRTEVSPVGYQSFLEKSDFLSLTGGRTIEKDLAIDRLVWLYRALGGRGRFSDDAVTARMQELMPDHQLPKHNSDRPRGAVHITNPRLLKSIPPSCTELARLAGFEVLTPDQLEEFDAAAFVRNRTDWALADLNEKGIRPMISIEELLDDTREK